MIDSARIQRVTVLSTSLAASRRVSFRCSTRRELMKLSRSNRIIVGILTGLEVLFPFVIMPILIIIPMVMSLSSLSDPTEVPTMSQMMRTLVPFMTVFYPFMLCFSLMQLGLAIFYVIHAIKNRTLSDNNKILFVLGTFLLPYIGMPVYFIMHLWKETSPEAAAPPAA